MTGLGATRRGRGGAVARRSCTSRFRSGDADVRDVLGNGAIGDRSHVPDLTVVDDANSGAETVEDMVESSAVVKLMDFCFHGAQVLGVDVVDCRQGLGEVVHGALGIAISAEFVPILVKSSIGEGVANDGGEGVSTVGCGHENVMATADDGVLERERVIAWRKRGDVVEGNG